MQSDRRNTVTLVLGGVRSGKSHYAQQLGERAARVVFVATAQARRRRDAAQSRAPPEQPPATLANRRRTSAVGGDDRPHGPSCDLMIIDCLTFFAANLLDAQGDEQSAIEALCSALKSPPCSLCWCRTRWAVALCRPIRRAGVSAICWAR